MVDALSRPLFCLSDGNRQSERRRIQAYERFAQRAPSEKERIVRKRVLKIHLREQKGALVGAVCEAQFVAKLAMSTSFPRREKEGGRQIVF